MIRGIRENLGLKLISLATAVMIWSYAVSDRAQAPSRQVVAEVVAVGEAPRGLDVELRTSTVLVEVTGPRTQLDAIAEGSVKAVVDLSTAKAGARALRVVRFIPPPEAPGVTIPPQNRVVEASVRSVIRKRVRVVAEINAQPPPGKRFSAPVVEPGWADVDGPRDSIEKVVLLVARPDVKPSGFLGQVVVDPVDRQGIIVPGVKVDPPNVHVQVDVMDMEQARDVVVSPIIEGTPAPPLVIESVTCTPAVVTVVGQPQDIAAVDAIRTVPVKVEGLKTNLVREVPLDIPTGMRTRGGRSTVEVSIRVRDASRPAQ